MNPATASSGTTLSSTSPTNTIKPAHSDALRGDKAMGELQTMNQLSGSRIQKSHNLSAPVINGYDSSIAADNNLLEEFHRGSMYFGTENSSVITTQIGAVAHLPCTIHFLHGEGAVSTPEDYFFFCDAVSVTTRKSTFHPGLDGMRMR